MCQQNTEKTGFPVWRTQRNHLNQLSVISGIVKAVMFTVNHNLTTGISQSHGQDTDDSCFTQFIRNLQRNIQRLFITFTKTLHQYVRKGVA